MLDHFWKICLQTCSSITTTGTAMAPLSFPFRGRQVPVTYKSPSVSRELAELAVNSGIFSTWYRRCEKEFSQSDLVPAAAASNSSLSVRKRIDIHGVEIQSVDLFGSRVGFVKIKSDCSLVEETRDKLTVIHQLPGICLLRGNAVAVLVALFAKEDASCHSLLVEQPRIPMGQVACWELPAGMMEGDSVVGTAAMELQEECGIDLSDASYDLVDLTAMACQSAVEQGRLPEAAIAPSPGGCDEMLRVLYLERRVTLGELEAMRNKLTGLREHGEVITLRVVPMDDIWKVSGDAKAMIAQFLLERLRQQGQLPPAGALAKPLKPQGDPQLRLNSGVSVPQLAFGLYKVPDSAEGEQVVLHAIRAGYRHFDTAAYYGNEEMLGRALQQSGKARSEFYLSSKVWNDAVKAGREAVRQSVEDSLRMLQCEYLDLMLIHWPVPGCFVEAYQELESLYHEGKLRAIGLSNFSPVEYQELVDGGMAVPPAVNQFENSPLMYRPKLIRFFQDQGIAVAASKSLNRAACLQHADIASMAQRYSVTPAQVVLRWSFQKGLIVVSKSAHPLRMALNRNILHFTLSDGDMEVLDSLTPPQDIAAREALEAERKKSL